MKTSSKRLWQFLIILHFLKTSNLRGLQKWFNIKIEKKIEGDKIFLKCKIFCFHVYNYNYDEA